MTRLNLEGLSFSGPNGRPYGVTLSLLCDEIAHETDRIGDTVDARDVIAAVEHLITSDTYRTSERLGRVILEALLMRFTPVRKVDLQLTTSLGEVEFGVEMTLERTR